MSYKIDGFEIDPESAEGRELEEIVRREDVTPEEAIRRALRRSGEERQGGPPRHPSTPRRPAGERDPESGLGMFADLEGFEEAIQRVIARRNERYTRP